MVARLLAELVIPVALFAAILYVSYRYVAARQVVTGGGPELDVSRTPSSWFTDSRTTDDGFTEVCIVRVETKSGIVRERRVLSRLDNTAAGYTEALDTAMDEAYAAMRVANVNLHRR
jgi:hypothetical protein